MIDRVTHRGIDQELLDDPGDQDSPGEFQPQAAAAPLLDLEERADGRLADAIGQDRAQDKDAQDHPARLGLDPVGADEGQQEEPGRHKGDGEAGRNQAHALQLRPEEAGQQRDDGGEGDRPAGVEQYRFTGHAFVADGYGLRHSHLSFVAPAPMRGCRRRIGI